MPKTYEQTLIDEAVRRALGGRLPTLTTRTPAPTGTTLPALPHTSLLTDPQTGAQRFVLGHSALGSPDLLG